MSGDRIPITPKGYKKLYEELNRLKKEDMPAVTDEIAIAREYGDLKENAEYHAARDKQSMIQAKLEDLSSRLARAEVIDITGLSGDKVQFGAIVTLLDEETEKEIKYQIVGEYEAKAEDGLISASSPFAKALMGKSVEDQVEIVVPKGVKYYQILSIAHE